MESFVYFVISVIFLSSFQQNDFKTLDKELSDIQGISVKKQDSGKGVIIFFEDAMFSSGQYNLSGESIVIADKVSGVLNDKLASRYLYIEGHTDNVGPTEANESLSALRANSVADRVKIKGFEKSRVDIVGYGDRHPQCSNDSEDGRKCNRRVQIVVIRQ